MGGFEFANRAMGEWLRRQAVGWEGELTGLNYSHNPDTDVTVIK